MHIFAKYFIGVFKLYLEFSLIKLITREYGNIIEVTTKFTVLEILSFPTSISFIIHPNKTPLINEIVNNTIPISKSITLLTYFYFIIFLLI